ncbi:hypothetical protein Tco_1182309 [Tanacetum coccineum]
MHTTSSSGKPLCPKAGEQDFTSTNWRLSWDLIPNCQEFRMTGPTPDSVTPVKQVARNDDNPNNSPSLQDQILNHMSSLKLIEPIRLTFGDEEEGDKAKACDKGTEEKKDEDLQKS